MAEIILYKDLPGIQESVQFLDNMYIYTKYESEAELRTRISQKYSGSNRTREQLILDYMNIGFMTKEQIGELTSKVD